MNADLSCWIAAFLFSLAAILDDSKNKSDVSFISLKKSMTDLLLQFLTVETDLVNTHMLLGKRGIVCAIMEIILDH